MTLGMLVASVQITNSVIQPSQQLSTSILEIMGSKSIRNKIDQIINTQAIKIDSDIEMTRQVKLDKVSVNSSENKKLLQDIELTFEFGKKYAVIGQSGAGKTSLLNLLAGNYDCYEGEILIDGSLYRKDRGQLNVTYVRQSPYLFKETISKNVTMLSNHQTREINDALIKVAFFSDKNIDEIAVDSLSGGEKQRISIARSYLKKSTFLLLDEISSSLDFQTKQTVMTNICEAMKGTVVFVTHDLSKEVLTLVDQIIVMNNGRIVGMGDYRTLLDSNLLPLASTE
ncbi:ATP-binding cassette domain-containing protein [Enterococcus termitis]